MDSERENWPISPKKKAKSRWEAAGEVEGSDQNQSKNGRVSILETDSVDAHLKTSKA